MLLRRVALSSPKYATPSVSGLANTMATTRTHGVFINTVGILYASLGFSLSVLTALFGVFYPFINPPRARSSHSRPHLPRKLRRQRIVRSFSDQTGKVTVTKPPEHHSIEKECTHDIKSLRRRSNSLIPIIMIDHFESTNSVDLLPKSFPNPANTDGATVNLSRPRIKRRCSSPFLGPRITSHGGSAHDWLPVPPRKQSKSTRKSPSVADVNPESSFFLRKAGKNSSSKSHEPPHFCAPPIPSRSLSDSQR